MLTIPLETQLPKTNNGVLQQLNNRASAFESQNAETDRLATIQAARDLISELQTPQESMVDITYSVLSRCILDVTGSILLTDSPYSQPTLYASASESISISSTP